MQNRQSRNSVTGTVLLILTHKPSSGPESVDIVRGNGRAGGRHVDKYARMRRRISPNFAPVTTDQQSYSRPPLNISFDRQAHHVTKSPSLVPL